MEKLAIARWKGRSVDGNSVGQIEVTELCGFQVSSSTMSES